MLITDSIGSMNYQTEKRDEGKVKCITYINKQVVRYSIELSIEFT